ncbi:MAG: hypothetical protein RL653_4305 [Pseudomonadota bacterium]|jgi:hypothetical protein
MFAGRSVLPSPFAVVLSLVVASTALVLPVRADDTWWHLRAGEEVLARGALLSTNTFSFTAPDAPWLMHEWLTEVIFALTWRLGGAPLLVLLGLASFAVTVALGWRLLARDRDTGGWAAGACGYLAVLLLPGFSLRPWILTHACFAGLLLLLQSRADVPRRALGTAVLFAAWANLHGSFFAGLLAVGAFLGGALLGAVTRREDVLPVRAGLVLSASAVLGSLCTPRPIDGLLHPLQYATGSLSSSQGALREIMRHNLEWQPPGMASPLGLLLCGLLVLCAAAVALSRERAHASHLLLLGGFSFLAFSSLRNIPLAALAAAPLLGRHLALAWGRRARSERTFRTSHVALPAGIFAACAVVILSRPGTLGDPARLSPEYFPGPLMAAVRAHAPARTFNHYDFGGAFQWQLWPEARVFWDQRVDCYPADVLRDGLSLHAAAPGWEALLEKWDIDAVAYRKGTALTAALRTSPGWRVAWEDDTTVLFLPASSR